jgi:hypothetical protein
MTMLMVAVDVTFNRNRQIMWTVASIVVMAVSTFVVLIEITISVGNFMLVFTGRCNAIMHTSVSYA